VASPEPVKAAGRELTGAAAEAAEALKVTDKDRELRRQSRRRRKPEPGDDIVGSIIESGDDPNFFGIPYIWVQLGHIILGPTVLAAALISESGLGEEFAIFDLQGPLLKAVQNGVGIIVIMNFLLAGFMFFEEISAGPGRLFNAIGWALKALLIGGVAHWQRLWRLRPKEDRMPVASD